MRKNDQRRGGEKTQKGRVGLIYHNGGKSRVQNSHISGVKGETNRHTKGRDDSPSVGVSMPRLALFQ